jgi:hypothetical protein
MSTISSVGGGGGGGSVALNPGSGIINIKPCTKSMQYARFPKDAPSQLEDRILSIVCGNSNLHWALHLNVDDKFVPCLFWKYVRVEFSSSFVERFVFLGGRRTFCSHTYFFVVFHSYL